MNRFHGKWSLDGAVAMRIRCFRAGGKSELWMWPRGLEPVLFHDRSFQIAFGPKLKRLPSNRDLSGKMRRKKDLQVIAVETKRSLLRHMDGVYFIFEGEFYYYGG